MPRKDREGRVRGCSCWFMFCLAGYGVSPMRCVCGVGNSLEERMHLSRGARCVGRQSTSPRVLVGCANAGRTPNIQRITSVQYVMESSIAQSQAQREQSCSAAAGPPLPRRPMVPRSRVSSSWITQPCSQHQWGQSSPVGDSALTADCRKLPHGSSQRRHGHARAGCCCIPIVNIARKRSKRGTEIHSSRRHTVAHPALISTAIACRGDNL